MVGSHLQYLRLTHPAGPDGSAPQAGPGPGRDASWKSKLKAEKESRKTGAAVAKVHTFKVCAVRGSPDRPQQLGHIW